MLKGERTTNIRDTKCVGDNEGKKLEEKGKTRN